jgi:hypothetical protein
MRIRALFTALSLLLILGAAAPAPCCPAAMVSAAALPALASSATPAPILAADPPGPTCTLRCETDKKISCTSRSGDCQYFFGGLNDVIVCDGNPTTCPLPAP